MLKCKNCKHCIADEPLYYFCELKIPENKQYTEALEKCEFFCDKNAERNKIEGLKYDEGKNRMGLVLQGFSNALWEVGRVGTFGCQKYGENSWQNLDNAKSRYLDALCRHLFKHLQGEKVDDESGLLHLQHMCWNALCLLEFELEGKTDFKYKAPIDIVEDYIKTEEGAKKIMEIMKESEE